MFELVINGSAVLTGHERAVRLAGSDEIRSISTLYDTPWCRSAILAAARLIQLGPATRFFNGRARLTIEIRHTAEVSTGPGA